MKKKLLITLLICIPFISIILVVIFRLTAVPTNEEVISQLKNIKCYKTDVEYITKNSRGEETEKTTQYYSENKGARIDFGQDRVKFYKDNKITVKDNISNKEYTIEEELDILHSLAFMNNLLSYPIKDGSIKEGQEEWGEKIYIELSLELFLENDHLNTAKVFIDKKERTPIGAIIYDKEDNDRLRIIYKNFEKLEEIDNDLL
ncbi:germination lipoprotein GerS-related protein [Clostridium sp.]|uniref:germination lipoprotein GerS-related protein n=1 Tax=Clostridium sp. TaxID=1506 RepID=UPI002FCC2967